MSYQSRFVGRLRSGPAPGSIARRLASQAAARQARRDVALAASRVIAQAAVPRFAGATSYPSRYRTGGYAFQGMGGQEQNFKDTTINGGADTSGSIFLLNGLQTGGSTSQRIGRKIFIKQIVGNFRVRSRTTTLINDFRVALVLDRQANAADTNLITNVYDAVNPVSLRNIGNGSRFVVLQTWEDCNIGDVATVAQQTEKTLITYKYYKRCNIPVTYNSANAGTIGDIQTNALYLICMGSQAAGEGASLVEGTFRIRYTE